MTSKNRSLSELRKQEELKDLEAKTNEIREWIESSLKEKLPKGPFRELLVDGVVLCRLANAVKKDSVKRFHKKPTKLLMKMENIAFFLTACKGRFHIPPGVMFAPTDIQEESDSSMRKIINVLLLIKQEAGGGPSAAEAAREVEEREARREKEMQELIAADVAAGVIEPPQPKTPKATPPPPVVEEPAEEKEPAKEPEPEPEPSKHEAPTEPEKPKEELPKMEVKHETPKATPGAAAVTNASGFDFDYYLEGKSSTSDQGKILGQIVEVINAELSLESKIKLVHQLQGLIQAIQNKVMACSNDDLQSLAFDMGLGRSRSDVPTNKDRQWYMDFILKHGRAQ